MNGGHHTRHWSERVALVVVLLVSACGEERETVITPPPPEPTAEELVAAGWAEFERDDLGEAFAHFAEAIEKEPGWAPPYVGAGWSGFELATDEEQLLAALDYLDRAIEREPLDTEAHAGRAAVLLALCPDSLAASVVAAGTVREMSPDFVFSHRPSFDHKDLILVEAFAQAAQGKLAEALAAADEVEQSGIREDESETWLVDGAWQRSFADAVLARLRELSKRDGSRAFVCTDQ
jgi:tetratricopeptide (TPR) repeat protein